MKVGRIAEISKVFIDEGLGFLTRKPEASSEGAELDEAARAKASDTDLGRRLRRALERLGPTFVKFGQLLGTRVDLFGEELIAELEKLHSDVAPFPTDEARSIIESELGKKIDEVFVDFPDAPIAAASIAQVYKARIRDGDGAWVAVKVQRPGLEHSLIEDLDVLVGVSGFVDRLLPPYRRRMVHRIAEEYAQRARGELNFVAEADAIERFAEVLTTLPEFRAPAIHRHLCTPRLLVMEWVDGRKLGSVKNAEELTQLGFEPERFAHSMLKLQISMSYEHGFVHGDTHPGNIILQETGHIGLIDFGLHGYVPKTLRDKMLEIIFTQSSGRIDDAVAAFVDVFQPDPALDVEAFKSELHAVLTAAQEVRSLTDNRLTEQLIQGMRVGAAYRLKSPSELFMVLRNLTIVEGIVLRYAPKTDLIEEMKTITGGVMRRRLFGPSMQEEMTKLLPQILFTLSKRPKLAESFLRMERSFSDSKNLGDFLRREQVIEDPGPKRGSGWWVHVLVGALGVLAGMALQFALNS